MLAYPAHHKRKDTISKALIVYHSIHVGNCRCCVRENVTPTIHHLKPEQHLHDTVPFSGNSVAKIFTNRSFRYDKNWIRVLRKTWKN